MDTKTQYKEVPRQDKPKKKTKVYKATFTKEKSPLIFRNFLTFSLFEDFETEFYVDNEFYIQQILEMDRRHFEQYRSVDDRWFKFSDFQSPSSFYLKFRTE